MRVSLVITLLALSLGSTNATEEMQEPPPQSFRDLAFRAKKTAEDSIKTAQDSLHAQSRFGQDLNKNIADQWQKGKQTQEFTQREMQRQQVKAAEPVQQKLKAMNEAAGELIKQPAATTHNLVKKSIQIADDNRRAQRMGEKQSKDAAKPIQTFQKGWGEAQNRLLTLQKNMQKQNTKSDFQAKADDLKASRMSARASDESDKEKRNQIQRNDKNIETKYNEFIRNNNLAKRSQERKIDNARETVAKQFSEAGERIKEQWQKAQSAQELFKNQQDRAKHEADQQAKREKDLAAKTKEQEQSLAKKVQEFAKRNDLRANAKDAEKAKAEADAEHDKQMKNMKQGLENMVDKQHEVIQNLATAQQKANSNMKDLMKIPARQAEERAEARAQHLKAVETSGRKAAEYVQKKYAPSDERRQKIGKMNRQLAQYVTGLHGKDLKNSKFGSFAKQDD